jgi:hypothetical protein
MQLSGRRFPPLANGKHSQKLKLRPMVVALQNSLRSASREHSSVSLSQEQHSQTDSLRRQDASLTSVSSARSHRRLLSKSQAQP